MTRSPAAAPALAAIAASAGLAVWYAPQQLLEVWRDTRNGATQTREERLLAPAESVGIGVPDAIAAAARVMPPDARYSVVTGDAAPAREPGSLEFVGFYASYRLLPRRRVATPAAAQWILSYGAPLDRLGVRVGRVVWLGEGVAVARAER